MLTIDFSPLYRSTIGFDRLIHTLEITASAVGANDNYPPYNIEKTGEDTYRLTMAVAGFAQSDLTVEVQNQTLTVSGRQQERQDDGSATHLYRGIPEGGFEQQFELAEYVQVTGAHLADGLLSVELVRDLPEQLRPRRIEIRSAEHAPLPKHPPKLIEAPKSEVA